MTTNEPAYKETPPRITELREAGGCVVFTNGCFDLLHSGHISYLRAARSLGDALVVGLNSDASVRKLKGPSRPVVSEKDRAIVLEALESVNAVVIFSEDTPIRLMRELKPAVYVKGGDYRIEDLPEAEVAAEIGAEVKILPFEPGYSTTALIERIKAIPSSHDAVYKG
ncbi:MAG: D-glycero-beta-D-manno-heptose 1-phosphate adenylyltransferase [Rubrobacter sp.]|nr:D-glycero-beta-D-manno-heptose 1-phosphate adenylyltransferase [Rubrobacter sp.]